MIEKFNEEQEERLYRVYITDALCSFAFGKNRKRWADIIAPLHEKKNFELPVDEAVIRNRLKNMFNESVVKRNGSIEFSSEDFT